MKNYEELEIVCPICHNYKNSRLGDHIRKEHNDKAFQQAVLDAKKSGMLDVRIGEVFGITFRQLEKIITDAYGVNISVLRRPKKIKYWAPKNFKEETTTVWSYKQRGDWATHDGRYRGNWSPYIPRNVILKYSQPGDVVLDYFVGGGTTAVEAKLLGRKCIAKDINPMCVALTKENLNFNVPKTLTEDNPIFEPQMYTGDARDLSEIEDNTIDLICAHPPYAGIIKYSSKVEGDLSMLNIDEFLREMKKVAQESYRVLKPGKKCAILIGDTRKHKHVVPIGFQTINVFMDAGFKLKELVIKRQHNCKTTGFWSEKSIKYNFLLLAHEYLPIFEKPSNHTPSLIKEEKSNYHRVVCAAEKLCLKRINELETTTVWILPQNDFEERLNKNVIDRYSKGDEYSAIVFTTHCQNKIISTNGNDGNGKKKLGLLFIKSPFLKDEPSYSEIDYYLEEIRKIANRNLPYIKKGGFLVIQTQDIRIDGYIHPIAKRVVDTLSHNDLWLKEIIVVTQNDANLNTTSSGPDLKIVHQYLLVYEVRT